MKEFDETHFEWNTYPHVVEQILEEAREKTQAEVGVLFLSSDGVFLEAADWKSLAPVRPPASELPTYWLDWWNDDDTELDGLTAFVALRRRVINLSQKEVFEHPAHKGKWDAVFLEGERGKCKGILAAPLQNSIGKQPGEARIHGVLKVENPHDPDAFGRFKKDQEDAFVSLARAIALELDRNGAFWQQFVRSRADLKVSHIVELLEKGRSLQYNLSLGLGYVLKIFSMWLGCGDATHVFWPERNPSKCDLLHQWDLASGQPSRTHEKLQNTEHERELLLWLKNNVGPKVVQPGLEIGETLFKTLFPNGPSQSTNYVDVVRLKSGRYDLGALLLPHSHELPASLPVPSAVKLNSVSDPQSGNLETLTRLALNVVSILGRFVGDEYDVGIDTYPPEHRLPRASKTCTILFGDIRNFSQLTQILRLMGKPEEIELFLDCYCARIGKVINDNPFGRVDKFMGDGVMALFGEQLGSDDDDNEKKVVAAVVCAKRMIEEFDVLYQEWFTHGLKRSASLYGTWRCSSGNMEEYDSTQVTPLKELIGRRFNENVRVSLGIGINIGDVFFDYFGYGTHREYTAIGDHVNFAQRLQSAAGEYDEKQGQIRASVLLSQTTYQYLQDYGYLLKSKEPIWLRFKGFGFLYPIYELDTQELNFDRIVGNMNGDIRNGSRRRKEPKAIQRTSYCRR